MADPGGNGKQVRRRLVIRNKLGLHARAAVKFVQLANKFKSDVMVTKDGVEANGKSIMGLLTLVAAYGMEIEVVGTGPDAEQMVAALATLAEGGFDEGIATDGSG